MSRILIILIRAYQLYISPFLAPACRFHPTCSQYAIDALASHGTVRGLYLAVRRLLKCHPYNAGGFDPVEDVSSRKGCRFRAD